MAQWGVRRHARKTSSTGCEEVEKAGWTGSDGDRHALVLCDFLPYPVQFANNCHPRSHEVGGNTSFPPAGGTEHTRAPWGGTHNDPHDLSFLVHMCVARPPPANSSPGCSAATRCDGALRAGAHRARKRAGIRPPRSHIFVRFALTWTALRHDCYGDGDLLSSRRSCQGVLTSGDWRAARPL